MSWAYKRSSGDRSAASGLMTEDERPCGLGQFLPMSCRGRAEAFARRLHSRLRTLGSQDGDESTASESSWLAANEISSAVTSLQPRHSADTTDMFMDFGMFESPGSPEEEITESELTRFITNKDDLRHAHDKHNGIKVEDLPAPPPPPYLQAKRNSLDSDSSDGQYYDPENSDIDQNHFGGRLNGVANHDEPELRRLALPSYMPTCSPCDLPSSSECTSSLSMDSRSRTISEGDSLASCSKLESPSEPFSEDSEAMGILQRGKTCGWDLTFDPDKIGQNNNEFHAIDLETLRIRRVTDSTCSDSEPADQENCYCSQLDVPNDLTVECPVTTHLSTLEIRDTDECGEQGECLERPEFKVNGELADRTAEESEDLLDSLEPITDLPDTLETVVESTEEEERNAESDSPNANCLQAEAVACVDTDDSEPEGRIPRVRRCSSLKTGKTPPGTPGRKKIVRFADVLGLDLADVRTFLDEIPKIPTSAFDDLSDADLSLSLSDNSLSSTPTSTVQPKPVKTLVALFQQPGGEPNFLDRVRDSQVCLENAVLHDPMALAVAGSVRVRNLDFHKSVHIRYSLDSWKTFSDLQATYVSNSCDGFSDKFSFTLYVHTLNIGERLEFAVRFHCKGCQYWDNNQGANYCFQCLPTCSSAPYLPASSIDHDNWSGASFYYNN